MLDEAISVKQTFLEGYPSFTRVCTGLLKPKGSALKLLKSAFNAENFICLSWSIFKHFVAIPGFPLNYRIKIQDFFKTFPAPQNKKNPSAHLAKLQAPELF